MIRSAVPVSPDMRKGCREAATTVLRNARAPRLRTIAEFAEDEIILPDGPFKGERFSLETQPFARLWFEAIDDEDSEWIRYAAVGPTQSGKTLICFVIVIMYYLFEMKETVVAGVPTMDMAGDKWREDLEPAIRASKYRDLIPKAGSGSRGGKITEIKFRNGATLKFMSGGGDDGSRSAFTARVLVITEADRLDEAQSTSRESNPITQMEGRVRSHKDRRRIFLECTATIDAGAIWVAFLNGTHSQIFLTCPHCNRPVLLDRSDFRGWEGAQNEIEAMEMGAFHCNKCDARWSKEDREAALETATLLHEGQHFDDDNQVVGETKPTRTFSMRWSAIDNTFTDEGEIGWEEWTAERAEDPEDEEKRIRQQLWAKPYDPPSLVALPLTADDVSRLANHEMRRGMVPLDCQFITVGVDVGMYYCHWVAIAWCTEGRAHIFDYDTFDVLPRGGSTEEREKALEVKLPERLAEIKVDHDKGWQCGNEMRRPRLTLVDSGYFTETVYNFCATSKGRWLAVKGKGVGQKAGISYTAPVNTSKVVLQIGHNWHVSYLPPNHVAFADGDFWKGWLHRRFRTSPGERGCLTLFSDAKSNHKTFAKHMVSECETQQMIEGKGLVKRWTPTGKANHYLDASYYSAVAGSICGWEVQPAKKKPQKKTPQPARVTGTAADGRSFLVSGR